MCGEVGIRSDLTHQSDIARGRHPGPQERAFLASAAETLADHLGAETPGIIVVADPVSLGFLRQHYPPGAKARLLAELGRDFTGMTTATIIQQLALA